MKHERNAVKFVGIGFNDACTDFVVKFHNYQFDQLEQAIRNVKEYNEYNGAAVAKVFASIKHLVYSASFGREGSPVLYIELKGGLTPIGIEEVFEAFRNMRKSKPDESDTDLYNPALLRFWWD